MGGIFLAIKGIKSIALNWKENPIRIWPILGIIKANFWVLIRGRIANQEGFKREQPQEGKRKKKPKGIKLKQS